MPYRYDNLLLILYYSEILQNKFLNYFNTNTIILEAYSP